MSIYIRIIGDDDGSDEYLAAVKIKAIFEKTAPSKAIGEIALYPNATLYGQSVKDVDLIMVGALQNCNIKMTFDHNGIDITDMVQIESFCTAIEVKSHSASGIIRTGTDWKVRYGSTVHNVTRQSNKQREAMKSFLTRALGDTPFITNLIYFTEISENELQNLATVSSNPITSNAFSSEFDFKTVMELLGRQRVPQYYRNGYHIESGFYGNGVSNYISPLTLFDSAKESMGDLTRKKIEMITKESIPSVKAFGSDSLTVYRGKAGTGKTINLMQLAIHLVDQDESRVVILTYNRALVSDIRRLFALADLPDMFDYKCVSIMTLQSFFYHLVSDLLFDGVLDGKDYLKNYDEYLSQCIEYLKDDGTRELAHIVCDENENLDWDYILIDEGQDWSLLERDLIMQLYDTSKIIVADGGQQFVRKIEPCDWNMRGRKSIRLKECLRQKSNLTKFINHYNESFGGRQNKIISSEKMKGGQVIIVKNDNQILSVLKRQKEIMISQGNIGYDMLILTTADNVENQNGHKQFSLKGKFEADDILIWDGTNDSQRLEYSIDPDEARVLQYESARGLEGWVVCCLDYDRFIENKTREAMNSIQENALLLESIEEAQKKYIQNWAMISLTRPIDTLVLTLKNASSEYSQKLLGLAAKYPDYITVV